MAASGQCATAPARVPAPWRRHDSASRPRTARPRRGARASRRAGRRCGGPRAPGRRRRRRSRRAPSARARSASGPPTRRDRAARRRAGPSAARRPRPRPARAERRPQRLGVALDQRAAVVVHPARRERRCRRRRRRARPTRFTARSSATSSSTSPRTAAVTAGARVRGRRRPRAAGRWPRASDSRGEVSASPQRQQRGPRPLQQRLHEAGERAVGELTRVGADEVETRRCAAGATVAATACGASDDVGVEEDQHRAGRRLGEPVAGPRLAQPARRTRPVAAVDDPHARIARAQRGVRRRRCRRTSRRRARGSRGREPSLRQQRDDARLDPRRPRRAPAPAR